MLLAIDEAFLPATLTAPPMTDTQFAEFCSEHPDLLIEVTAEGELVVMPPTFTLTGLQNQEIVSQLSRWEAQDGLGVVVDSSGGFVLPNGARRSPDASWTLKSEVRKLARESLEEYWRLSPPSWLSCARSRTALGLCAGRCGNMLRTVRNSDG